MISFLILQVHYRAICNILQNKKTIHGRYARIRITLMSNNTKVRCCNAIAMQDIVVKYYQHHPISLSLLTTHYSSLQEKLCAYASFYSWEVCNVVLIKKSQAIFYFSSILIFFLNKNNLLLLVNKTTFFVIFKKLLLKPKTKQFF